MNNRTLAKSEIKKSTTFSPVFGKKLSSRSFMPEPANEDYNVSSLEFGHNFGDVRVKNSQSFKQVCPLALNGITHYPFGGTCHTYPGKIQAKLKINHPCDRYEQEANKIADLVMRDKTPQYKPKDNSSLLNQKTIGKSGIKKNLSFVNKEGDQLSPLIGNGESLPDSTLRFFNVRFGYDFSQVKINRGEKANQLARSMNARALTIGKQIYYAKGQFVPESVEGKRLIAHELTHVLQQNGAGNYSSMDNNTIQRAAPAAAGGITIGAIAAKCIIGAIIGALFDAAIQAALQSWKKWTWKFWKTKINYCSIILSAILGCIAAPISAFLLEPWITAKLGTKLGGMAGTLIGKILLFIAKKLSMSIPKSVVGKLAKLGCISPEQAKELGVK